MATRVLAFLAALGMVVAAFAVRGTMDRDGSDGGGDGGDEFVLVCATELGDLCDDLDATKEAANKTADRLIALGSDDDAELDAWLVPGPWPQMVDMVRELDRNRPIFETTEPLAQSPLTVVARGGALDPACAVQWTCLADAAADGSNAVGAPPAADAIGIVIRAAALSARVGTTDYGSDVFDEHGDWLTRLTEALDRKQFRAGTLRQFLTISGSADAFVTVGATATSVGVPSNLDRTLPEPAVSVQLTLGLTAGASRPSELDDELRARHGWAQPPGGGDDGLPSPDVLYALRDFL